MKTSLRNKLRAFTALTNDKRERRLRHSQVQLDELAQASQDMVDMKDCYDSLLSAAAATENSVFELSESLREMGDCLLEKTALNDDENSDKVLLMLGKVQFELQKLADGYRAHIFRTITVPSESLLNELSIVEEMKRQCDEKREVYEEMKRQRDKGKVRGSKGDCFSSHHMQIAYDEYDEMTNSFVFRMRSLRQGQSRSLLTQAARHHAAQLSFFRKALKSLEAIEPHVKLIAEQHHIDYQISGLEEDVNDSDDDDNDDESGGEDSEARDDGELRFDYGQANQPPDLSAAKTTIEENLASPGEISFAFQKEIKASSKSAPLYAEKNFGLAERPMQLRPSSSRKYHLYVLPTPSERKSSIPVRSDIDISLQRQATRSTAAVNLWHSSPLNQNKREKIAVNEKFSGPIISESVLRERNSYSKSSQLPPPLMDGLSARTDSHAASDTKRFKRQAFSGPLMGKPWPSNPISSASRTNISAGFPPPFSSSTLHSALPRPTSTTKLPSHASTSLMSSPKINELHELPVPPAHLALKRPANRIAHSGPLVSNRQEFSPRSQVVVSSGASVLPLPPQTISRSFSIPSRGQIEMAMHVSKPLEAHQNLKSAEDIASPPLTPISLSNFQPASPES